MINVPNVPNQRGQTRDYIYNTLKAQILTLELKPGTKISEKEVSDLLNVSRTPVREAFLKLSEEELLEIYPQRGTVVSLINLDHVEEDRFIRENIERAVVRLACSNFTEDYAMETNLIMQELCCEKRDYSKLFELDDEFHKILFEGTNKKRTWKMVHQQSNHFNRLRLLRLSSTLDWNIIISQHKEIYKLVKEKKPDQAEKVMFEHLGLVVIEKDILKKSYPDYFN